MAMKGGEQTWTLDALSGMRVGTSCIQESTA